MKTKTNQAPSNPAPVATESQLQNSDSLRAAWDAMREMENTVNEAVALMDLLADRVALVQTNQDIAHIGQMVVGCLELSRNTGSRLQAGFNECWERFRTVK
jgi:hypothetical protein